MLAAFPSFVGDVGCGDVLKILVGTGRANVGPSPIFGGWAGTACSGCSRLIGRTSGDDLAMD